MSEIPEGFKKIVNDFLNDINTTFPEFNKEVANNQKLLEDDLESLYIHSKEIYPQLFFDILYKNEKMFVEKDVILLPNIDFKNIWGNDISDNTKEVIWKYLQLILFTVINDVNDSNLFGTDTSKLFEAIDEDALKSKLEETMKEMSNMFDLSNNTMPNFNDLSGVDMNDLPTPDDLHDHISSLMGGKIGALANEIAEETAKELKIDLDETADMGDVFQKLFKNPGRLIGMVKKVGNKIEEKIKSGEIKESELMEEAQNLMSKMDTMPGMKNFQKMFGNMGFPNMGGGKMNMNGMKAAMNNKIKVSKQRERMLEKLKKRREEKARMEQNKSYNHSVYNEGEKMEKSKRKNNKKKKRRKKKKKQVKENETK